METNNDYKHLLTYNQVSNMVMGGNTMLYYRIKADKLIIMKGCDNELSFFEINHSVDSEIKKNLESFLLSYLSDPEECDGKRVWGASDLFPKVEFERLVSQANEIIDQLS